MRLPLIMRIKGTLVLAVNVAHVAKEGADFAAFVVELDVLLGESSPESSSWLPSLGNNCL